MFYKKLFKKKFNQKYFFLKSLYMEKISILIPTYNRSKFIQLCIMNILRQDYPKELLEVIILDDGETPFIENE